MPNVVIYARTSTDAQKVRQTGETQIEVCRQLLSTRGGSLLGVFSDDGVSGTLPLRQRPSGSRMLQLCATGAVDALIVFRLDRLSRRLGDVVAELESFCPKPLEIWSVSEGTVPDLRNAGSVIAQAMEFAAMELDVVSERMNRGRDRVAALGKWTSGPVPFGYDLDDDGRLIPSSRVVAGVTEAELARSVFIAMAGGSTTIAEARRLQELGVAPGRRYSRRIVLTDSAQWRPSRIRAMIRNPLYAGTHDTWCADWFFARLVTRASRVPPSPATAGETITAGVVGRLGRCRSILPLVAPRSSFRRTGLNNSLGRVVVNATRQRPPRVRLLRSGEWLSAWSRG
ncbi:MAG: hypothetical protein E6J19_16025 [Chloroflexi bacterium]|nr:MAG: hypothetical protein E6J19_16025 [Chloroflexota bacterium]